MSNELWDALNKSTSDINFHFRKIVWPFSRWFNFAINDFFLGLLLVDDLFFTVIRIADLAACFDVFRFVAASKLSGKLWRNNSFPEELTAGSKRFHINGKHFQPEARTLFNIVVKSRRNETKNFPEITNFNR